MLRPLIVSLLCLSFLTGVIYPALVTGVAHLVFPEQAFGSLITKDKVVVGSRLVGQEFSSPRYFWGRPSATSPMPYNAQASSGSNLSPTNPALLQAVASRADHLQQSSGTSEVPSAKVPVDLVTSSASGLDPHITPHAAYYQVGRISRARHVSEERIVKIVDAHIEGRTFGLLGERRVNVLLLNMALDESLR